MGIQQKNLSGNLDRIMIPGWVGFVQFDVRLGDIDANLKAVERGLERLAPTSPGLVVLPELWATGFAYDRVPELAAQTSAVLAALQALAGRYDIELAGSLLETEQHGDSPRYYNTLFVTGPAGVRGSYRKQELFEPLAEPEHFMAGRDPRPLMTGVGLVGALVCYDLRFPELARAQVAAGAGLLMVSAQWPAVRLDHWLTLIKARAIENQVFMVAANGASESDGLALAGHSLIVGPDGGVLAMAGRGEEAAGCRLDPTALTEVRGRFNTAARVAFRHNDGAKVLTLPELAPVIARYKAIGRRVVFTNGCFDLLHQGHVTYLEEARRQGDCLVIGLNSDRSIREIKGPTRPVNGEQSRARVLAALGCVDFVVVFDEATPLALITTLLPDVLVKGADWPVERIVGAAEVLAAGGRVANIPLVGDFSTTGIIERIRVSGGG